MVTICHYSMEGLNILTLGYDMSIKKLVVSHAGSQGVLGLVETDLLRQLASHQTDLVYGHKNYRVSVDIVSHSFEVTKIVQKPLSMLL